MVPGRLGRVTEHVVATKLQCMYSHFRTNPVVTRTVANGICLLHLAGSSSSRGIGCCRCATIPPKNLFFPSLSPPPSCCCVKRYHFGPPVRKTMTAPHPGSHDDVSSYYTARCDFDVSSTRPVLLHRDFFSFFLFSGCIFDRCGTKCQLEQFAPPPTLLPIYAFAHLDNL